MVAVKTLWGPGTLFGNISAISTLALNDADNSAACAFSFPKDGTIDAIGVRASAETGTSPAYNCGLVTMGTTTPPTPSSSAYGGSSLETVTFTAAGWVWTTLTTPATVVAGEIGAVRYWPTGSVPDGSNFATLAVRGGNGQHEQLPCALEFTTAWAANGGMPLLAARYSDGEVVGGVPINATAVAANFNSGTTPDEYGNLFQVPFDCTCIGFRFWSTRVATTSLTCRLLDAAGSTLKSVVLDQDQFAGSGVNNGIDVYFDAQTLSANTDYRVTFEAMEATNRQVCDWTFPDAGSRSAVPEGLRWEKTSRVNGGAFTDDDTHIILMALWLSDITVSGGGGSTGARRRVW